MKARNSESGSTDQLDALSTDQLDVHCPHCTPCAARRLRELELDMSSSARPSGAGASSSSSSSPRISYGAAAGSKGGALAQYDADGDGVVSAEEILSLDKDGDGRISEAEISDVLKRMKALGGVAGLAQQQLGFLDAEVAALRAKRAKLAAVLIRDERLLATP